MDWTLFGTTARHSCCSLCHVQKEPKRNLSDSGHGERRDDGSLVPSAILSSLPEKIDLSAIRSQLEETDPFSMVSLQESERLNQLLDFITANLKELESALAGNIRMTVCGGTLLIYLTGIQTPLIPSNIFFKG